MRLAYLLLFCACATPKADPVLTPEQHAADIEAGFRQRALERAAFDLRCPAADLKIHVLNSEPGLGAQVGVECGDRRMVYVFKQVGQVDAAWVAESASGP